MLRMTALILMLCVTLLEVAAADPPQPMSAGTVVLSDCRVVPHRRVVLASPQAGILADVTIEAGERVLAKQLVAQLDDRTTQAALKVAEKQAANDIEIRAADKAAQQARLEYDQALESNRRLRGTVSQLEVSRLKLAAERSTLQAEFARHNAELAQLRVAETQAQLDMLQITAPFSGVVTEVFKLPGEAVSPGDPIVEIVNTDTVRLQTYIAPAEVGTIRRGMPVQVRLEKDTVLQGQIAFVDVSVNPVTEKVRVWAKVANQKNQLKAGQVASMSVHASDVAARLPLDSQEVGRLAE